MAAGKLAHQVSVDDQRVAGHQRSLSLLLWILSWPTAGCHDIRLGQGQTVDQSLSPRFPALVEADPLTMLSLPASVVLLDHDLHMADSCSGQLICVNIYIPSVKWMFRYLHDVLLSDRWARRGSCSWKADGKEPLLGRCLSHCRWHLCGILQRKRSASCRLQPMPHNLTWYIGIVIWWRFIPTSNWLLLSVRLVSWEIVGEADRLLKDIRILKVF